MATQRDDDGRWTGMEGCIESGITGPTEGEKKKLEIKTTTTTATTTATNSTTTTTTRYFFVFFHPLCNCIVEKFLGQLGFGCHGIATFSTITQYNNKQGQG